MFTNSFYLVTVYVVRVWHFVSTLCNYRTKKLSLVVVVLCLACNDDTLVPLPYKDVGAFATSVGWFCGRYNNIATCSSVL